MKSGINYDFYDFNLSLPLKYPSILLSYENFKHMTSVHFVFALRILILLKISSFRSDIPRCFTIGERNIHVVIESFGCKRLIEFLVRDLYILRIITLREKIPIFY